MGMSKEQFIINFKDINISVLFAKYDLFIIIILEVGFKVKPTIGAFIFLLEPGNDTLSMENMSTREFINNYPFLECSHTYWTLFF